MRRVAVVLAGGASRRFGADKLSAVVDGRRLLDRAVAELPAGVEVVLVGPAELARSDWRVVREDPPGGGPAAGLVRGLVEAVRCAAEQIVVLPGDAPHAGRAAIRLLDRLAADPPVDLVLAEDPDGRAQPLQLALTAAGARALVAAAGPTGAAGESARRLVESIRPPATRERLAQAEVVDIDTPAALQDYLHRYGPGRLS